MLLDYLLALDRSKLFPPVSSLCVKVSELHCWLSSCDTKHLPRVVSPRDVQRMDELMSLTPPDCLPGSLLDQPSVCYLAMLSV